MVRFAYAFDHPHEEQGDALTALLGGKGANLADMTVSLGLPVPPGFTISTEACRRFRHEGWPPGLDEEIEEQLAGLERRLGRGFGDPEAPLLVSVRSGAAASMPGMMDTILNVGLNEATTKGLGRLTGDDDFGAECHRRLVEMYTSTVGVDSVPEDPRAQLRGAVEAVFRSWDSDRARVYRAREGIDDDAGTAVTVQAMVFGNLDDRSATGVCFSRDPSTGEPEPFGDILFRAQGEDVVAGTHATQPLATLDERLPEVGDQLREIARRLERHHRDLVDIEFTVEQGHLWMLQVRRGKRSPEAAVRIAVDLAEDPDFPLDRAEAVSRVKRLLGDPPKRATARSVAKPLATGLGASPGVAHGALAVTADDVVERASRGEAVILVRPETSPSDVHGMADAAGIVTARGGMTSHAAVVARGWGKPAVVGVDELQVGADHVVLGGRRLEVGHALTLDGTSGHVYEGAVDLHEVVVEAALTLREWAVELGIALEDDAGGDMAAAPVASGHGPAPEPEEIRWFLSIRGMAGTDMLAEVFACQSGHVEVLVESMLSIGHLEETRLGVKLTPTGADLAREAAELERAAALVDVDLLDEFARLDHVMKEIVTAWQMRDVDGEQVFNDHTDPDYDGAVLDRLAELSAEACGWLGRLEALPAIPRCQARFDRSLTAARTDPRYVASPAVDSFHNIWFELHEYLIRLAGRTRSEEADAGRA
jgi:pyruvate, orthophosphate dikinase